MLKNKGVIDYEKDKKITIKPNLRKTTKYTEEEKTKLFKEGAIRSMSHVKVSKKIYTRKSKYKGDY